MPFLRRHLLNLIRSQCPHSFPKWHDSVTKTRGIPTRGIVSSGRPQSSLLWSFDQSWRTGSIWRRNLGKKDECTISLGLYRKIPIVSPGLLFVQKAVLLGLFSDEPIFGGAYYWKKFCVSKCLGLTIKNSLKHYENSLKQLTLTDHMGLYSGGLLIGKIFASDIWGGGIFGRAYFWRGLLSEFYGINPAQKAFRRAYHRREFCASRQQRPKKAP